MKNRLKAVFPPSSISDVVALVSLLAVAIHKPNWPLRVDPRDEMESASWGSAGTSLMETGTIECIEKGRECSKVAPASDDSPDTILGSDRSRPISWPMVWRRVRGLKHKLRARGRYPPLIENDPPGSSRGSGQ